MTARQSLSRMRQAISVELRNEQLWALQSLNVEPVERPESLVLANQLDMTASKPKPRCEQRTRSAPTERGSMTFFGMGMVIVLLFVGGISADLWRVFGERRALTELADAAAAAGANGVDRQLYRDTGTIRLDPGLAHEFAWISIEGQIDQASLSQPPVVDVSPDLIVVEVKGSVELMLLKIFAPGEPLEITVTAESTPIRGLTP